MYYETVPHGNSFIKINPKGNEWKPILRRIRCALLCLA